MLGQWLQGLWASELGGGGWGGQPSEMVHEAGVSRGRRGPVVAITPRPHAFFCSGHRINLFAWKAPFLQMIKFKIQQKGYLFCEALTVPPL